MTFDDVFQQLPGDGWLSRAEAEVLWRLLAETTGAVLEVGCYVGRSACLLASTGRSVYCVDPYLDGFDSNFSGIELYERFRANLRLRGLSNVSLTRKKIEQWEPPVGVRFGLCYLDGDHTYTGTAAQVTAALRLDPQVIAAHDVNDGGGGAEIKRAALEILGEWDERVERLAVWRRRK